MIHPWVGSRDEMGGPIFILVWLVSIGFTVLFGVAMFTYVFRTWQKIRAPEGSSSDERILDHLDQMQTQLYSMSEKLQRIEHQLTLPPGDGSARAISGPDDG